MSHLLIAVVLAALPARAHEACSADAARLCAGVKPGEGRIVQCLHEHAAELSAECKAQDAKEGAKFQEKRNQKAKEACGADVEKFCKKVEPGEGRKMECLSRHRAEVSDACRQFADDSKDAKESTAGGDAALCKADAGKLCPGKEFGSGLGECLKANLQSLSAECGKAVRRHMQADEKPQPKKK